MIYSFEEIDETYRKGLEFLAESQEERGYWTDSSYGSQPGVVGMAILAFLARGDDPEFGPYRIACQKSHGCPTQRSESENWLHRQLHV